MKTITAALMASLLMASSQLAANQAEKQFNFATGLLIKNEHTLAADEFETLLKQHPDYAKADIACYRLGEARQKAGDDAAAQKAFERVLQAFPNSERLPQAHYWLGQLKAKSNPKAAAKHYEAITTKWPDHTLAEAAAYGAAESYFKADDWPAAIMACELLLKRFPEGKQAPNALYTRGWAAFQSEKWRLAQTSFDEFVKRQPAHELAAHAREKAAQALHKLGEVEESLARLTELAKLDNVTGINASLLRGTLLFEQGEKRAAALAFEEAAKRLDQDARLPACLMNAGHAWIATKEYNRAAAAFRQITQNHAQNALAPTAAYWLGHAQQRAGKSAEAVAIFTPLLKESALQEAFGFDLRMLLAEAHLANQAYTEAATAYTEARKLKPDHPLAPEAWVGELIALEKAGSLEAAEQTAAAFLAAHPDHKRAPEMRFWLGEFRFRRQAYAAAAEALTTFIKQSPQNALAPEAHYKLGWCARETENHAAAFKQFEKVYSQWSEHPLAAESALRAAQSAEVLKQDDTAFIKYGKALALAPAGDVAEQALLAQTAIRLSQNKSTAALKLAETFVKDFATSTLLPYAQLYRAEALSQLERFAEALKIYKLPLLQQKSVASAANFGQAWALERLQRPAEAAAIYEKIAKSGGTRAHETAYLAARAWEQAGEYTHAQQAYARLVADEKQTQQIRDEAAYREANCAWQAQDTATAIRLYGTHLTERAQSPFAPQAIYDLAWVLLEQEKQTDAEARFQELIKRFPTNALASDVHFRLGELAYQRHDFDAAAASYQAALKHPDLAFVNEVRYKLGWSYEQLKRPDDAIATFAKLAESAPDGERAAEARYRQGRLLHEAGKYEAALAVLTMIKEGKFAEHATLLKSETLRALKRHQEALKGYQEVLKTWPEGSFRLEAQLGKAHSQRAVGAHRDALDTYNAVAAAGEGQIAAQAILGQGYCHYALQEWPAAAKAFLKVDILFGYEALKQEALTQLVKTWEQAGDAEKAARYREELTQRYPQKAL